VEWEFESFAWALDPPLRLSLRNRLFETKDFDIDEQGTWRLHDSPVLPPLRDPHYDPVAAALLEERLGMGMGMRVRF
jgi:hypothetical protein